MHESDTHAIRYVSAASDRVRYGSRPRGLSAFPRRGGGRVLTWKTPAPAKRGATVLRPRPARSPASGAPDPLRSFPSLPPWPGRAPGSAPAPRWPAVGPRRLRHPRRRTAGLQSLAQVSFDVVDDCTGRRGLSPGLRCGGRRDGPSGPRSEDPGHDRGPDRIPLGGGLRIDRPVSSRHPNKSGRPLGEVGEGGFLAIPVSRQDSQSRMSGGEGRLGPDDIQGHPTSAFHRLVSSHPCTHTWVHNDARSIDKPRITNDATQYQLRIIRNSGRARSSGADRMTNPIDLRDGGTVQGSRRPLETGREARRGH